MIGSGGRWNGARDHKMLPRGDQQFAMTSGAVHPNRTNGYGFIVTARRNNWKSSAKEDQADEKVKGGLCRQPVSGVRCQVSVRPIMIIIGAKALPVTRSQTATWEKVAGRRLTPDT